MFYFLKQKQNLIILIILTTLLFSNVVFGDFFDGIPEAETPSGTNTESSIGSIGGNIFYSFFFGLSDWLHGGYNEDIDSYPFLQNSMFYKFSEAVKPVFNTGLVIAIIIAGLSMYFDTFTKHVRKLIKFALATVILLSFLDWSVFAFWIFDPLLDVLIGVTKLLLTTDGSSAQGLADTIFSVDEHFIILFNTIDDYNTMLNTDGEWLSLEIDQKIIMYLMLAMFAVLYAIFTILIIVGFFGFMMMIAFAPIFMAIGVFHKQMLVSWIKTVFNFFLIPIFTATVMSITLSFISDAAEIISVLTIDDSVFTKEIGTVFLVGIFSVGLHWKAPEFAAAISGGMVSGAGSIVGTAAAVGGGAWALSKSPIGGASNATNAISGVRGGSAGNQLSAGYRGGEALSNLYNKYRQGGTS